MTAWVTSDSSPGGKESPLRRPWLAATKGAGVGWSWYPYDPWCGGVAVAPIWDAVAPRAAIRRFRSSGRPGRSSSSGDAPFCLGWSAPLAWRTWTLRWLARDATGHQSTPPGSGSLSRSAWPPAQKFLGAMVQSFFLYLRYYHMVGVPSLLFSQILSYCVSLCTGSGWYSR